MPEPLVDLEITSAEELLGLAGGEAVGCRVVGVTAERAALKSIRFEDCSFVDCGLRLADLTNAAFVDCTFLRCNLMGVNFVRAQWPAFRLGDAPRFAGCTLDYASFRGLKLDGALVYGCSAIEADFGEADLSGADLRFSDLTGAVFDGADLRGADLSGATGYAFDLPAVRTTGAKLSMPEAASLLRHLGFEVGLAPDRLDPADMLAPR